MLFLDFETRSRAELTEVGGRNYVVAPSTEPLCLAALHVDQDGAPRAAFVWTQFPLDLQPIVLDSPREWPGLRDCPVFAGYDPDILARIHELAREEPIVAHNAYGFDRPFWERLGWPDGRWLDSLPLSRRRGLPGKLDKIGKELYDRGKTEGKAAMMRLSIPCKKTGNFIAPTKDTLSATMQYCLDDVLLNACLWYDECAIGTEPEWEYELQAVDAQINDRGIGIDVELCAALLRVEREARALEERVVRDLTKGEVTPEVLRSAQQVRRWLAQEPRRIYTDNLEGPTVMAIINHPHCPPDVRAVLWARIGETRISSGKLEKAIGQRCADGRLRDSIAYYGASKTGRWGGRNVNPHNLPRPNEDVDVNTAIAGLLAGDGLPAVLAAAHEIKGTPDDVIGTLVRSVIVPAKGKCLGIIDYSAVEGRGACWIADYQKGLDVYRSGRDPYIVMASKFYDRPYEEIYEAKEAGDKEAKLQRQAGKVAVLSAQYQVGFERLGNFAAGMGIDLVAAGITPQFAVEGWRDAHPEIAGEPTGKIFTPEDKGEEAGIMIRTGGTWKALHHGVFEVVESREPAMLARCFWSMQGAHLFCLLPSGRYLIYRNARIEDVEPSWGGPARPAVTYDHVKHNNVTRSVGYGGKWFQGITQSVCRDLLGEALVRLEHSIVRPVMHVHDEAISEMDEPEHLELMGELMVEPPEWAVGFPIAVDGFVAYRYGKKAAKGAKKVELSRELSHAV